MASLRLHNIVLLILGLLFSSVAFAAPAISAISPSAGPVDPVGSALTINGSGFGASASGNTVTVGGVAGTPTSWSDTKIVVPVPSSLLPGFADVIVTVGGTASNAASFLVIPVIMGATPQSAPTGASVTIAGTSFGDSQGSSTVTFQDIPVTPSSWSNNSITLQVPDAAYGGPIVVTVNGFATNGLSYQVTPTITGVSPAAATVGTVVTVSGTAFQPNRNFSPVTFGGVSATPTTWSNTSFTVPVPSGATTGPVVATVNNAASNGLNFTVVLQLVSLSITPANPSIALNAIQQLRLAATGSYSDGSSKDLTSSVAWSTSNASVAMVIPNQGAFGVVGTSSAGAATITASLDSVSSSTVVTVTPAVTPPAPTVSSVSPTSGVGGTTVSFSGSNFGAQQGTGSVWLGSTLGVVVTWSDTQIMATVSTGSVSGTARVQQDGTWSNAVPFDVSTPTVATVTPTNGLPGTLVTITGSGFGDTQGAGQVFLGTLPAAVISWNSTQILASIASGAESGAAHVLQNGVLSNAVTFNVNNPQISSVTPISGAGGTTVTITGSGFGTSQGEGIAWIGSAQGVVASWTDTQVVATVDSNAVSGIVRVQQNGIWSNALSFKVPPSLSTAPSVNINPNLVSMVVGETRSLQALDDNGNVLAGLAWTSTDLTVATLSTDDPPIITAVAPGHVTITTGNASADLTVYPGPALPLGTVQWSLPGDGSGVQKILPAVPSGSGAADVFVLQADGSILAVAADGTPVWTANVGTDPTSYILPDFLGGLAVVGQAAVLKLDGLNGQPKPSYNFVNPPLSGNSPSDQRPVRLFTDGTVLTVDGDTVVGIDPQTGAPKFSVQLEDSVHHLIGIVVGQDPPDIGSFIIAGDGYGYLVYTNDLTDEEFPDVSNVTLDEINTRVLRIGSAGDWSKIPVADYFSRLEFNHVTEIDTLTESGVRATPGSLISNADQGVFLGLQLDSSRSTTFSLATISSGGISQAPINIPDQSGPIAPMLQNHDGTVFATVNTSDAALGTFQTELIALDQSGNLKWSVPNFIPKYAIENGSVVAQSQDGTIAATLDQNGNVTGSTSASGAVPSWSEEWYTASLSSIAEVASSPIQWATGYATMTGGNLSGNGSAVGVFEAVEGLPVYGLPKWGSQCTLGTDKVPLAGDALAQYNALKNKLLTEGFITSQQCSTFFNADPVRASYFGQLTNGITRQVPYDGRKTNISQYDAGFWSSPYFTDKDLSILKKVPVCGLWIAFKGVGGSFVQPSGGVVAASQLQSPAIDTYINTKALSTFKQATLLHEVLHNLTGFLDSTNSSRHILDLKTFVGIPSTAGATDDISKQLETQGCANKN